jgi:hypothetical protein
VAKVEGQVVAAVLGQRLQHFDAELRRFEGDSQFSDIALLVRGEHLAILARVRPGVLLKR